MDAGTAVADVDTSSPEALAELLELVAEVLDVEPDELDDETGPENLESWTSRAHFELVTALEEVYEVSFAQADIQGMRSIADMCRLLRAKGVQL